MRVWVRVPVPVPKNLATISLKIRVVILRGCELIRQERKPTGEKRKPDQLSGVAGHLEAGRNGRSVGLTTENTSGQPVRPKMADT